MTRKVFAMPPVAYSAGYVTDEFMVASSIDASTGDEDLSGFGVMRRRVAVTIPALSGNRSGAGYMKSLERLLQGVHFVRLRLPPVNWYVDQQAMRQPGGLYNGPVSWTTSGDPLGWTEDGDGVSWFQNTPREGTVTTLGDYPAISISGLTPGRLVCRAFDVLRSYSATGVSQGTARAIRDVFADGAGLAVIPLHGDLAAGIISFGDDEEIVARPVGADDSDQPLGAAWSLRWTFREARPTEYADAEEVNPWI